MTRMTIFEFMQEKLKKKAATREEIAQLKLDLEREEIRSKIRALRLKQSNEKAESFSNLMGKMFGDIK